MDYPKRWIHFCLLGLSMQISYLELRGVGKADLWLHKDFQIAFQKSLEILDSEVDMAAKNVNNFRG